MTIGGPFFCRLNITEMEDEVKQYLNKKKCKYIKINDITSLSKIHDLFINDVEGEPDKTIEYFYFGLYFKHNGLYEKMIECYKMAIDTGDENAMLSLGLYYKKMYDWENMVKYYAMAIKKGNTKAMVNLARCCLEQNDINNMLKYIESAINKDDSSAMNFLGTYYKKEYDYDNMIKYYKMAIDRKNVHAMYNLGLYYKEQGDTENMLKYYIMGSKYKGSQSMYSLGHYYMTTKKDMNTALKYFEMAATEGNSFSIRKLSNHYNKKRDYEKLFNLYANCTDNKQKALDYLEKLLNIKKDFKLQNRTLNTIYNFNINGLNRVSMSVRLIKKLLKEQDDLVDINDIRIGVEI